MHERLKHALFDGLCAASVGDNHYHQDGVIDLDTLKAIAREATNVPFYLRRPVRDWHRTKRATFFPPHTDNTPPILKHILDSTGHIYRTSALVEIIAETVRTLATSAGPEVPSLVSWTPNRTGFNYLNGTPEKPAEIPEHTDVPEETGLVVAIGVVGRDAGSLSMIFGADTCRHLEMDQHLHSVRATEKRIGLTAAQLLPVQPSILTSQSPS